MSQEQETTSFRGRLPALTRRTVVAGLSAALSGAAVGSASRSAGAAAPPSRIVAAGGAITEIIYAVGAESRLVGVDSTSLFPPHAMKDKPNVGYVRALSAEGVLSLRPDLVLAIDGAGPPDVLALLAEAKVPVVRVPEVYSPEGVAERIRVVAAAAGEKERGRMLADETSAQFSALAARRAALAHPRRVMFVLSLQNGRPLVAGDATGAAAMIALAGGVNAGGAMQGYKPMSDEAVIAAAPDVVLMMDRGGQALTPDALFALPAFAATSAARTRALLVMDGLYLLGFGPRTPAAAADLLAALYPGPPDAVEGAKP